MASSTSDLIVRLSLDTTNFEGAMSKFEGQMTKLQASCTTAGTGITNFKQVTAQLQTSAQTLTDKLAAQKQKVADLEAAYEKSKAETGENSEETKKLAAQLEQAKQKVSQTEQALKLVTRQLKLSQNGFYQLGTQLENIGTKLESVGKKVSQVGQQLTTKVTTPIVALGTVCVKTFTSFDDSLKTVQATMGLVAGSSEEADRQIALLNSTAQEMGRATRYSASEAASALNYLALAGYDADEACAALPQVLALAQAGGLDLAYASDLATDAMAALGLSMDQLSNFSDQMAVTAQKSNTFVGQLGEAILTVGGTAKNLKGGTAELNAEVGNQYSFSKHTLQRFLQKAMPNAVMFSLPSLRRCSSYRLLFICSIAASQALSIPDRVGEYFTSITMPASGSSGSMRISLKPSPDSALDKIDQVGSLRRSPSSRPW